MSAILVRWATRWDRKALVAMVQALAAQHGHQATEETIGTAFEFALSNPAKVRFIVAQRDDELVGVASLHEVYSTWRAAPCGTIEDFFVVPEARGEGVGTAILELLLQEAQRRGYCRVQLQVQEDNDRAWRFYQARSFTFTGYLVYEQDLTEEL